MFGYVAPDNPNMYVKDVVLYKALYCGLCKSIGKASGQKARFALSYDLAFLSGFLHNVMNKDVIVEKKHCAVHPITKRPVARPDELSERIGALNIVLAYEKLKDDVYDENKNKLKKAFFTSAYKKTNEPELKKIVSDGYKALTAYEKSGEGYLSVSAEFFGKMLSDSVKVIAGEEYFSEDVGSVVFNLGKWIYFIDALDDFEKDKKKGLYNPFVKENPDINTKKELLEKKGDEIKFVFSDVLSEIAFANKNIKYYFNHDLIDNVFEKGLVKETEKIMEK